MDRSKLLASLSELGIEDEIDRVAPYAHLEIGLVPSKSSGRTRIGGPALLPSGRAWPVHTWPRAAVAQWPDFIQAAVDTARARGQVRDEGDTLVMPLSFLCQVDLAEVNDDRLPDSGLLLFFASVATDIEDARYGKRVAAAVLHVDGDLVETPQPPTPDPYPEKVLDVGLERRVSLDLPYEDKEAFRGLRGKARKRFEEMCTPRDALFPGPMEECSGPMPPPGEVSLLRLVEHDELGMYIGDASWVTFTIGENDLAARRFDDARASVFIG